MKLLQSNESKDEPNIFFMRKINRNGNYNTELKIETHYGNKTCVCKFCMFSANRTTLLNV